MRRLVRSIGTRVIPGLLIALGVTLVTAGMFTYTSPVEEGPVGDLAPITVSRATPTASAITGVSPLPSDAESSFVPATALPEPLPEGWPTGPSDRVATRFVFRELSIDIPVIAPGDEDYPFCGVAMYLPKMGQPGAGIAVYLYAHARAGMFLPILDASKIRNGERLLGMVVDVYTSDNLVFRYQVMEVRRHQVSLADAFAVRTEQLWLQTSEGPQGTPGKTQVVTRAYSVSPASQADAHPQARPYPCG